MENLLQVLQLDSTIVPQFIIFGIAYLALTQLVFKPYLSAYDKRKEATVGGQEIADQLILEAQDIQFKYEAKAKEINTQIKSVFDVAKKDATKLQEEIVHKAREEAESIVKRSRDEIRSNVVKVREDIKKQIPEISQTITDRLLGKAGH